MDVVEQVAEDLTARLYDDLVQDMCVVFVGAGSTTERSSQRPVLYKSIKTKASYPETQPEPSFSELMTYFCDTQDGGHKNRLIREAISYIEQFSLPGEDHRSAREVSRALSRNPFLKRFVTTNWDPFLERSLDVLVPTVEDRDLAFWDDRKRQVLKIHGCISRPYSIVATVADYAECVATNPLIFNKLRDLMATKTFIFLGYSMRDEDFREVWKSITDRLGPFGRLAYAVNPFADDQDVNYWRKHGVSIFKTSDTLFLQATQSRLEELGEVPSEIFLLFLREERSRIVEIHVRNAQSSTGGLASAMYQDGLLHGLDDVLTSSALGTKRNADFESERREAEKIVDEAYKRDNIIEIAYWKGRFAVLNCYCDRKVSRIRSYMHPDNLKPTVRFVKGSSWSDSDDQDNSLEPI